MNTQSILSGAAILMAAFGVVPVTTIADQRAATTSVSSVAEVSLSDLNLSTPEGMRVARDRLHTMAERVCADRGGSREPPRSRPSLRAWIARWQTRSGRSAR